MVVLLQVFRKVQRDTAAKIDVGESTPDDYTLFVTGFPKMPNTKQEIWKYFSQFGKIHKIDYSFELDALEKLTK
jgi:RNA recognition motif-containing protein